jgi:hypothetical protein
MALFLFGVLAALLAGQVGILASGFSALLSLVRVFSHAARLQPDVI